MILKWSLICILIIPSTFADKNTLPVFLLDYESVMTNIYVNSNPFSKVSSAGFANIILNAIKNSEAIIIFVEETFCIEDVSTKDKLGSPYYHLHVGLQQGKVKFMPAVEEPYRTLKQMFQPQDFNVFYLSYGMKLVIRNNFKYIYVFFKDGLNETRSEVLRSHDLIMKEVYYVVREMKQGPVLAFYTGKINPVVVQRVEFVPIKPNPVPRDMGVMIVSSGALFRFSGVYATTVKRRSLFNQMPMVAEETRSRRKMSTRMAYTDFEMQFNFSFRDKDWILDNVALLEGGEEVGRTEMGIGAPWNYSYVCGEPLILVNTRDSSLITISQYQIQPRTRPQYGLSGEYTYRRDDPPAPPPPAPPAADDKPADPAPPGKPPAAAGGSSASFGASVNCAPFFTSSILACLFVAFICLGICFYGIVCLYNINSNNRYDDPQGKQLVLTEN